MAKAKLDFNKMTIHDASTAELLQFAEEAAGVTFDEGAGRAFIIQEIYTHLEWDAYRAEDDATHVIIKLPKTKDAKHPYQGGFNGKMFTVARGVEVELPIGYYNTMIESAEMAFSIASLGTDDDIREGSPASKRLPVGALDISIVRFLNKGIKVAPPTLKAPPPAPKTSAPNLYANT